ncbi:MAG: glycerol-3-phosphate dehydrogenase [Legionellales bacterium]|nr:glycerol-3-phosphate dehydrogenase [Legionellales bacterium]|tara:strand:+ start:307 stop:1299 length:993 start_codon:yes stop_codon:yes gene_type:complete
MGIQSVLIQGAGSWGTALAMVLARNDHHIYLWDTNLNTIQEINSNRSNEKYLPGYKIPKNITALESIEEAPNVIDKVICAVPSHAVRSSLNLLKSFSIGSICIATKGFEPNTQNLNHVIAKEVLINCPIAILTGPSFAMEVAAELPTAVTISSEDIEIANSFSDLFHTKTFRIYIHTDYIGAQIGGAVKNVMAIAAGISDGLGYGCNARSALITRGLSEIIRLGVAMGAKEETFMGLAGLGDLILTCTDNQSRNRRFGILLSKNYSSERACKEINQEVEGLNTTKEVSLLAKKNEIEMPITEQVLNVLDSRCTAMDAVKNLLNREQREEF